MKPCRRLDRRIKEFRKLECEIKNPTEDDCYKCLRYLGYRIRMLLEEVIHKKWLIQHKRQQVKEKAKKKEKK